MAPAGAGPRRRRGLRAGDGRGLTPPVRRGDSADMASSLLSAAAVLVLAVLAVVASVAGPAAAVVVLVVWTLLGVAVVPLVGPALRRAGYLP